MKKYFTLTAVCLVMLFISADLKAQQRLTMDLGYSVNRPTGAFDEVTNKTSFRGFKGGITYDINQQFGVGLGVAFSDFYEKVPRQVYQTNEGAISAVVSNSIQVLPIVAKVDYSFVKEGAVRPYVSLGAGFNMVSFDQYLGEFSTGQTTIKPAFTGEAGLKMPMGTTKRSGITVGAHYNYLPFKYNGIDNLNSYGAHIGVYFALK